MLHVGPRTITLSPLYDVAATAWFLPVQSQAALPVGGKWRIDEITRHHLLTEARAWGIPEAVARSVIDSTVEALVAGLDHADRRFPSAPEPMRRAVDAQLRRLGASPWT
jgi:hypothetical protein